MIISKTPFRISFFGGGTDYPGWFKENGGAVLATTIDKYCYINCRYLPPFFEHKSRIVYSLVETVNNTEDIIHPSARETLKYLKIDKGVEIHHDGDLPARTGLGSSSSFTVGLLNALYALNGKMVDKSQLADEAIYIEQRLIKENVGCQDQIMASYGGFNRIEFKQNEKHLVTPVTIKPERIEELQNHLMLYYTGVSRIASEIAATQIAEIPNRKKELSYMYSMVDEALKILNSNMDVNCFGKLLNDSWQIKRKLTNKISNTYIDDIYDAGIHAGAIGGKLLGAGGGGFMLLFVPPELQKSVRNRLKKLLYVPFKFENSGSQIVYFNQNL